MSECFELSDNELAYNSYSEDDLIVYFHLLFQELKENGFLWQDKNGIRYKKNQLKKDKRYLRNIIKYAKSHLRPNEQIKELEQLLKESK